MMPQVKAQDYYAKMLEEAGSYKDVPQIIPTRPFSKGAKLFDQTANWIAAIATVKEINTLVQYITLNHNKVIFDPPIDFNDKKFSRVTVSDTEIATLFKITITRTDQQSQIWLVDTRNAVKVPGEIAYKAKRKN